MFEKIGEYYTNSIFDSIQPYSLAKIYFDGSEYLWFDLWFTNAGRWRISTDYGRNLKDNNGVEYINQHKIFMYSSVQYWAIENRVIWRSNSTTASHDWYISDNLGRGVDSYLVNDVEMGDTYWGAFGGNSDPEQTFVPYGNDPDSRDNITISLKPFTGWSKTTSNGDPWGLYQQETDGVLQPSYRYQGFTIWSIDGQLYTEQPEKDSGNKTVYTSDSNSFSYSSTEQGWVLTNPSGEGGWKTSVDLISTFNSSSGTFSSVQLNPFGEASGFKTATFNSYTNGFITGNVFDIASYV